MDLLVTLEVKGEYIDLLGINLHASIPEEYSCKSDSPCMPNMEEMLPELLYCEFEIQYTKEKKDEIFKLLERDYRWTISARYAYKFVRQDIEVLKFDVTEEPLEGIVTIKCLYKTINIDGN